MTSILTGAAPLSEEDGSAGASRIHTDQEIGFMRRALAAAEEAAGRGEVPVGAVVTLGEDIVGGRPQRARDRQRPDRARGDRGAPSRRRRRR